MKVLGIFIVVISFFAIPRGAFAHVDVDVHQEGSSEVTTCINGKCETKESTGKTTVCRNGECKTSDDGNYHYESDDGSTKIHVESNTGNNNSRNFQDSPTVTLDPNVQEKIDEAKKKAEEIRKDAEEMHKGVKERTKSNEAAISAFIEAEMKALQELLDKLF